MIKEATIVNGGERVAEALTLEPFDIGSIFYADSNDAGQVFLDAYPVTLPELEDRLRTEKALNPDFPVVVRGDATVQYQKVIEVLDLLRRLELSQVGLVTGKPT